MNRVQIISAAAFLAVTTGGGAVVATAQSPEAPAAGTCQVTVDRSQAAGSFRVDHQTLQNGDCVCYVYTGPTSQDTGTESRVAAVQSSGSCLDRAPVAAAAGGSNLPLYAVGGAAVAGGIAAIASSGGHHHNDSPGG